MIQELYEHAAQVRDRLAEQLALLPDMTTHIHSALAESSPNGLANWHIMPLLTGIVLAAIGFAVARLIERWGQGYLGGVFNEHPIQRGEKIAYLLSRTLLRLLSAAVLLLTGLILAVAFSSTTIQRIDMMLAVRIATLMYMTWALISGLLATGKPVYQLHTLDSATVNHLSRSLVVIFSIAFIATQTAHWYQGHDPNPNATFYLLLRIVGPLISAILLSLLAMRYRNTFGRMIAGAPGRVRSHSAKFLGSSWHLIAIVYFAVAWTVSSSRLLLGWTANLKLVASPIIALLLGLLVSGVVLLVIDYIAVRKHSKEVVDPRLFWQQSIPYSALHTLGERAAMVLGWAAAAWGLMWIWGINLSPDGTLNKGYQIMLMLFAGWFAYRAITLLINHRIEKEGGAEGAEAGEEGGASGVSRKAMLLSMFRKFLLIIVVTLVAMIVLSELGVDIGPLFAGAGVVGLAVGFGAQTLVRDVFSGAFFFLDDAFRIGEYIDVGDVKGTVEKISIRSMQLRHHNGPLNTIPFGEISYLTNFSRDWVMMKLKLRVTYDTDVDKVRKLIKKLGEELLEHPEIGHMFMQPLKSQGVYSMEDTSAIIIRVKYMTKPGDQFQTRKLVYKEVQEMFEREGIQFANHYEVIVRLPDAARSSDDNMTAAGAGAMAAIKTQQDRQNAADEE